jgi:hypothetical protein
VFTNTLAYLCNYKAATCGEQDNWNAQFRFQFGTDSQQYLASGRDEIVPTGRPRYGIDPPPFPPTITGIPPLPQG